MISSDLERWLRLVHSQQEWMMWELDPITSDLCLNPVLVCHRMQWFRLCNQMKSQSWIMKKGKKKKGLLILLWVQEIQLLKLERMLKTLLQMRMRHQNSNHNLIILRIKFWYMESSLMSKKSLSRWMILFSNLQSHLTTFKSHKSQSSDTRMWYSTCSHILPLKREEVPQQWRSSLARIHLRNKIT